MVGEIAILYSVNNGAIFNWLAEQINRFVAGMIYRNKRLCTLVKQACADSYNADACVKPKKNGSYYECLVELMAEDTSMLAKLMTCTHSQGKYYSEHVEQYEDQGHRRNQNYPSRE